MPWCRTKTICFLLTLLATAFAAKSSAADDSALEFWLSTSDSAPPGPEAPELDLDVGNSIDLFIWFRPRTGARLRNFSLNVVALQSGLDLVDGTFTILNSAGAGVERFEYVTDSSYSPPLISEYSEVDVAAGDIDSVLNLQGFTLVPSASIVGMGPKCGAAEVGCEIAADGEPAWLLGSVTIEAVTARSTIDLHLQVGEFGMNQEIFPFGDYNFDGLVDLVDYDVWGSSYDSGIDLAADGNGDGSIDAADFVVWQATLGETSTISPTSQVSVKFGLDTTPLSPPVVYNAASDRDVTLSGDDPDAIVNIPGPGAGSGTSDVPEPTSLALAACCLFSVLSFRP
jgi:hypothetical protein